MCEACQKGKQTKQSFKLKNFVSTSKPLELLHMDLFGPSITMSLGGNLYAIIVVYDFSRFTWPYSCTQKGRLILNLRS